MEIWAEDHNKAGKEFEKKTGKRFGVIYLPGNLVRPCGKTQAERWDWKLIK